MAIENAKAWLLPQGIHEYDDKLGKRATNCQCDHCTAFNKCFHTLSLFPHL